MSTILITGGGRGIGYELAKQLVRLPASQIALVLVTARGPSKLLDGLVAASAGRVLRFHCEATDQQSVQAFAAELDTKLGGKGVDILVNNIGVRFSQHLLFFSLLSIYVCVCVCVCLHGIKT